MDKRPLASPQSGASQTALVTQTGMMNASLTTQSATGDTISVMQGPPAAQGGPSDLNIIARKAPASRAILLRWFLCAIFLARFS